MYLSDQIAIMNWWLAQYPDCAVNHTSLELIDYYWLQNHREATHNARHMRFRNGQIDGVLHSLDAGYHRSDAYRFHFTNVSEWEDVVALYHQAAEAVDEPICGANLEDVL